MLKEAKHIFSLGLVLLAQITHLIDDCLSFGSHLVQDEREYEIVVVLCFLFRFFVYCCLAAWLTILATNLGHLVVLSCQYLKQILERLFLALFLFFALSLLDLFLSDIDVEQDIFDKHLIQRKIIRLAVVNDLGALSLGLCAEIFNCLIVKFDRVLHLVDGSEKQVFWTGAHEAHLAHELNTESAEVD